ncbi:MAG: hybrid sensor histidine kinase/response regulator [Gemmatimonadaceae bacterium]
MPTQPVHAPELRLASILIVDDEEANVRLLARILARAEFTTVRTTTSSRDVMRLFDESRPDLIVLDIRMPELDGFGVLAQLRERIASTDYLPVLAITGDGSPETRQRVLMAGAKDFLEKPFETSEVLVRVENLLTTRLLHRSLQAQNSDLEDRVRERTAQLEMALSAAEAASRAKSQFLATMSHELRTPLNSVIGFANVMKKNKQGRLGSDDLAFLDRIIANGQHLLTLVNNVLDIAKVEAGRLTVTQGLVAVDQLVTDVVAQLEGQPRAHGVDLRAQMSGHMSPIETDGGLLRQVLINLTSNALRFTHAGSVVVSAVAANGVPRTITVADTGIGIPAARLDAIFEPFEQAGADTHRTYGGTGLGLSISKAICDALGFDLTVRSEEGKGSAFTVHLDGTRAGESRQDVSASDRTVPDSDTPATGASSDAATKVQR